MPFAIGGTNVAWAYDSVGTIVLNKKHTNATLEQILLNKLFLIIFILIKVCNICGKNAKKSMGEPSTNESAQSVYTSDNCARIFFSF